MMIVSGVKGLVSFASYVLRRLTFLQTVLFLIHIVVAVYLSIFSPLLIRNVLAASFVEHAEGLEFTFKTCHQELHGICSFPEAVVPLEEGQVELTPGYNYAFSLDIVMYNTPQNKALGVFIANVQLKDEQMNKLADYYKSVPAFQYYRNSFFIQARNLMFFPLYLCGFLSDDTELGAIDVKFPSTFVERAENRTRFIVVQLQSNLIQISSATIRIHARVGLIPYFLYQFPILSYVMLLAFCSTVYFVIFVTYYCVHYRYHSHED